MPHVIMKRVWDYCTYSKKYFVFLFVLLFISALIQNYVRANGDQLDWVLLQILVLISVSGYGMLITRSRINQDKRLPKIVINDVIVLGIKSAIVMFVYLSIQNLILGYVSFSLEFPTFDLEDMLLHWSDTILMLFNHNPVTALLFVILGGVLFYITAFFMEIALAKLADTDSMLSSFNLLSIKRSIDVIGWRNYAKEYTLIVLTIVILSYLISIDIPHTFLDSIIDMILSFFIFATQYLGIGAVYAKIKYLESAES